MPIYLQYILAVAGVVFFIWFWLKFSPIRALLVAIINTIYGILLLLSITSETPGLTVILVVGGILTLFGLWGFVLWIKYTAQSVKGLQADSTEAIESWWQTVKAFNVILILGLALRFFVVQPFIVEGPSMEDSFVDQEMILVDKISYRLRPPMRGEVVIFEAPRNMQDDYIKRVIGLPGETVKIDQGKVYINGKLLNETFLSDSGKTPLTSEVLEEKVGHDEYFVMGDNRPHSSDSREWGAVPKKNLVGRAIVAIYPFDMFGLIETPDI